MSDLKAGWDAYGEVIGGVIAGGLMLLAGLFLLFRKISGEVDEEIRRVAAEAVEEVLKDIPTAEQVKAIVRECLDSSFERHNGNPDAHLPIRLTSRLDQERMLNTVTLLSSNVTALRDELKGLPCWNPARRTEACGPDEHK